MSSKDVGQDRIFKALLKRMNGLRTLLDLVCFVRNPCLSTESSIWAPCLALRRATPRCLARVGARGRSTLVEIQCASNTYSIRKTFRLN